MMNVNEVVQLMNLYHEEVERKLINRSKTILLEEKLELGTWIKRLAILHLF